MAAEGWCFEEEFWGRPVCPDCATVDDRLRMSAAAQSFIDKTRAQGRELSLNEKMWEGETAELRAQKQLDEEEQRRLTDER